MSLKMYIHKWAFCFNTVHTAKQVYLQPVTKHTAKKHTYVVINYFPNIDWLFSIISGVLCTILVLLKTAYFYDHVLFQYPQIQQNVLDIVPKFLNLTHCRCHQGVSYITMVLQITYPEYLLITLIFFNMYMCVKIVAHVSDHVLYTIYPCWNFLC